MKDDLSLGIGVSDPLILLLDAQGRVRRINAVARAVLGYSEEDVCDREFCGLLVHPDDAEAVRAALRSSSASAPSPFRVSVWLTRDRTPLPVRWSLLASAAPGVTVIAATREQKPDIAYRDIFQRTFQLSPLACAISRISDGRFLEVNESFLAAFEFAREEILGRTSDELGLWALPEEREAMMRRLREEGVARDFPAHIKARSGKIRRVRVTAHGLVLNNEAVGLCVIEDISERARIENELLQVARRWRSTFDAISDMVLLLDAQGVLLDANRAMRELLGAGEFAGRPAREVFADKIQALARCTQSDLFLKGTPVNLEVQEPLLGGRWFDLHGYPIRDDSGQVRQYVYVVRDVTEHKQLEEQLRRAQKLEAVGRLAGGVAHDFNNLLTAITGYSELALARPPGDPALRSDIEEVHKAGERATLLTSQLLAFSRRDTQQIQEVQLNDLLHEMEKLLGRLLGEHIEVKIAKQPDLGRVKVDPVQMQQVIINLALNARDAMPDGGVLSIRTANTDVREDRHRGHFPVKAGAYVTVTVRDSGIGMDAATLSHLFEPFFTTKKSGQGVGLGLSTVYGIIKQSGGSIEVESEVGHGASFTVFLPRLAAERMVAAGGAPAGSVHGGETVLLVEDEEAVRRLAATILRSHGYRVIEADSGVEALRISRLHQGPVHLLLTDVVLPRVSGPSLAERMMDFKPDTRVLFMSGYTEESSLLKTILTRDAAFLPKPFTPEALMLKVREVLDAPAKRRAPGAAAENAAPPPG